MTIPLDRLYQYILSIAAKAYGDDVIIYRFWPHGSKKLDDLNPLIDYNWTQFTMLPHVYCNDQEPLQYDFYENHVGDWYNKNLLPTHWNSLISSVTNVQIPKNLKYVPGAFEKSVLLHSEKRSQDVQKYQHDGQLIPAYYWSHAVIARDWFRYAQHVKQHKQVSKNFLIYNRAWSGTREYRLKFLDLLIELGLASYCRTSVSDIEPELAIHYKTYKFSNTAWKPTNTLENFFPLNTTTGHYSADFDIEDYQVTDIEVVLETLFDDDRLHLTEKSLRPIACGQPFILVATHGSLEYLRSYGFKTFGHIWDERYDQIEDSVERLATITELMRDIANWLPEQQATKIQQAREIAEYNRQWFFSQEFFDLVVNELSTNLKLAFEDLTLNNNYNVWLDRWSHLQSHKEIIDFLNTNQNEQYPTLKAIELLTKTVQNKL